MTASGRGTRVAALGAIFLAGALARVALRPADVTPRPGSDQDEYDTYAWNLAQGNGYRGPSPAYPDRLQLTSWRMPGPSLLFAGVYKLVGHEPATAVLANILLSAATSVVLFFIGRRLFGEPVGYLTAIAYAFWPHSIPHATTLTSESLFTLLLVGYVLHSLVLADRSHVGNALANGLLLGAVLYARPHVLLLPFVAAWILLVLWPPARRLASGALVLLVAALSLAPWMVRNQRVHGSFVPFTTQGGEALLLGSNRIVATEPRFSGYALDDARQISEYRYEFDGLTEVQRSERALELYRTWMRANRGLWGELVVNRFRRFWTPFLFQENRFNRLAMLSSWGPVLLLFPVPFFVSLARYLRDRDPRIMAHFAILSVAAAALIFSGIPRYRLPIEGLCLVFASASVVTLVRLVASRARARSVNAFGAGA